MFSQEENELMDEESIFNILIATDIHLGFNEKHPVRGDDSFITFEEILNYGKTLNADLILLGGDLFHENKPSRRTLQRCMDLLRKYCLGPGVNSFDFLSDPDVNFLNCATPNVNFEDPNLRVSLPVFSIHGNHDDPCGEGNYSVMDMLATSGFVNYFGKVNKFDLLKFQPILLKKGETCVSIYGIGSMNDDRLFRLFQEEKVLFEIPAEYEDEWFNILVLHQNRARHGSKNYTAEHLLPDFVDLVFWGHEHECRLEPEDYHDKFRITQPGSSVATSLCPGEAVPKHVGMLKIYKKQFTIDHLPLRTTRPLVFDTLSLEEFSDIGYQFASDEVIEKVRAKVEEMMLAANDLISGHPLQPTLPLLRLRIEHENDQQFANTRDLQIQLGLEKRVANPDEVIKLVRKRAPQEKVEGEVDEEAWDAVFNMESINMIEGHLENLLVEYFQESSKKPLVVMHERTLAEGVRYYVEKGHNEAFRDLINLQVQQTKEQLKDKNDLADRAMFREAFAELREQRNVDQQKIIDEAHSWLSGELTAPVVKKGSNRPPATHTSSMVGMVDDDFLVDEPVEEVRPARGRGRARGRARAASTRARAKAHPDVDPIIIDDDDDIRQLPKATPERGRTTRGRATRARATQSSSIAQAFARQSQPQTQRVVPQVPTATTTTSSARPSHPSRPSTSRGICYVSDSDSD